MDAQPDVGEIAEAFTSSSRAFAVLSHEIAHVANLPVLNDGQRLLEAIERSITSINTLRTDMNSSINTLRTDMNSNINTLRTDMNSKFDSLDVRLRADSLNHTARVYNSHISNRDTPLRALHDQYNMAVEGFPRDPASLMRLPGNTLTTLLNAFQLPADGTVEMKKRRFREFVGLVVDA